MFNSRSASETEVPLGRPLLPAWWAKFPIRSQWVVVLRPHSNLCRLPSGCPFPWSWGPAAAALSSPHSSHVVSGAPEWFRQGDGGRESAAPHSRAHSFLGGCSFLETHAGASTGVILGSPEPLATVGTSSLGPREPVLEAGPVRLEVQPAGEQWEGC